MIKILDKLTNIVSVEEDNTAIKKVFSGSHIVLEVGLQKEEKDYKISDLEVIEIEEKKRIRIEELEKEHDRLYNKKPKEKGARYYWGKVPKTFKIADDYSNLTKKQLAALCYRIGVPINYWRTKPETIRLIKEKLGEQ